VSKKTCSEFVSVCGSDVDEWKCLILGQILDSFSSIDAYIAGDTGLFWKALPDHTVEFKNESVVNRKIDIFDLSESGWRKGAIVCDRKVCKARAFMYADSLPGEYRAS
jgi:hypothetical protein